jgi:hypothetical protein
VVFSFRWREERRGEESRGERRGEERRGEERGEEGRGEERFNLCLTTQGSSLDGVGFILFHSRQHAARDNISALKTCLYDIVGIEGQGPSRRCK